MTWTEGKAILAIFEGDSLPTRLYLGNGLVSIRVEPYIEATRQCHNCYRFGHFKDNCKYRNKICRNCSDVYHGECQKEPKSANCKGSHFSTARECPAFQKEVEIKKNMVFKNISYWAAREMYDKNRTDTRMGEKAQQRTPNYEDEKQFPRLPGRNRPEFWERKETLETQERIEREREKVWNRETMNTEMETEEKGREENQ